MNSAVLRMRCGNGTNVRKRLYRNLATVEQSRSGKLLYCRFGADCGRITGYSSLIGLGKSCRPNVPYVRLGRECRTPTRTARRIADPEKSARSGENPVTGERSVILQRPWDNPASRVTGELTALVGARVMGEHRHPALVEQFTVLEGALSIFEIWWTRWDSNPRPPHCERGKI